MDFFFYGTLLDCDVMALVIGRRLPPAAFVRARLTGFARRRARGVSYPVLVRAPAGRVEGAVVGGLTRRDVERLAAYEGPRYRIAAVRVMQAGTARSVSIFEPLKESFEPVAAGWDLAAWQGRHKRPFLARLRRALSALPAYSRR
ncbi:MAG: gamma-glutamylcyclotransferase family protein [Pseudomonadota bacterium]